MLSLLLAIVLSSVTSETPVQQDYAAAYRKSVLEDKPLMVVVGAPWCPACNVLKDSTLTPMAESGELESVSLVMINRDEQPELVKQLTKGVNTLPQIIVFSREADSQTWQRRRLTGFQARQPVRTLIRRALGRG